MTQILAQGCKAGALAGFLWGLLILAFLSPLILEAEKYEVAAAQKLQTENHSEHHHHHHHEEAISSPNTATPEFEPNHWQRPLLTVFGSCLLGLAYGMLFSLGLAVAMHFQILTLQRPWLLGSIFGVLGFLVLHGIPALGLSPELPGILGAEQDFEARQAWWILSVFCSSVGLIVFFALPKLLTKLVGALQAKIAALILALCCAFFPFLRGVPPHSELSVVPAPLKTHFLYATLGVNAVFWILLGGLVFYFVSKRSGARQA